MVSAEAMQAPDLVVLHEHPEWQKPLFAALERRGVRFAAFDLKRAAFDPTALPTARLYVNQASPSAYLRGHERAVPLALAFLRTLETNGARVLNGSRAFALELSKTAQLALLHRLGIRVPRTLAFNDVDALLMQAGAAPASQAPFPWPALLKPEQGGSGARMFRLESPAELARLLQLRPELWSPDHLLLLQELVPSDPARGIVRVEIVGGAMLYAMRVVSHGRFNLCPSVACNPDDGGESACALPSAPPAADQPPVAFIPYPDVPDVIVAAALAIARAGGLDVAGIECIETPDGPVFYDVNANSNLRASIGAAFGFDPFERVVDYLVAELDRA
jgi:glutathione synthase/RimK-type ligase-like ATP-grasp enzyme